MSIVLLKIALLSHFCEGSDIRTNFILFVNFVEIYNSTKKSFITSTTGKPLSFLCQTTLPIPIPYPLHVDAPCFLLSKIASSNHWCTDLSFHALYWAYAMTKATVLTGYELICIHRTWYTLVRVLWKISHFVQNWFFRLILPITVWLMRSVMPPSTKPSSVCRNNSKEQPSTWQRVRKLLRMLL